MNKNIIWVVEGKIKDGLFDEFNKVMHSMVETVRPEEGTTHYEWFIGEDGKTLSVYERYKDADAAITHVNTSWSAAAESFMSVVDITGFIVYSDLTPKLKEMVGGLNPIYMKPVGGFGK